MPVRVTQGVVVRTSAHLCASSLQGLVVPQDFYSHFSIFIWNDLGDPVFDCVGLAVSRAGPAGCSLHFCLLLFSLSLLSFYGLVLWGWGLRIDWMLVALFKPSTANL